MDERLNKAEQLALLLRAREGDPGAEAKLLEFLSEQALGLLAKFARMQGWSGAPIEDAVSEAVLRWYKKPFDVQRGTSPASWFNSLALWSLKTLVKRQLEERLTLEQADTPNPTSEGRDDLVSRLTSVLQQCVARLGAEDVDIFLANNGISLIGGVLRETHRMTRKQLAEDRGLTEYQAYHRVARVRTKLATLLRDGNDAEGSGS